MKDFFLDMVAFERWANERVLEWMEARPPHPEMTRNFAHLIGENVPWLHLLRGEAVSDSVNPEPDWSLAECRTRLAEAMDAMHAVVRGMDEAGFAAVVRSPGPGGAVFENTAAEVLTGLLNHGEHHRGQILMLIAQATGEYVPSLYMSYLRRVPTADRRIQGP